MPSDALAKLLEAASKDCDGSAVLHGECLACGAKYALAALASALARELIKRRSAGEALAKAIQHGSLGDQVDALDVWLKLTETEVRDGRP